MTSNEKNLTRRYLIWCFKTTKEELDRIDRYFTQSVVDDFIFEDLIKTEDFQSASGNEDYKMLIQDFEDYKIAKIVKARQEKYLNEEQGLLQPKYQYLASRLSAIESAIIHFFGEKELKKILELYEEEMTQRIMSARDHS